MVPALWAAKTGLDAQQTRMATISNNLANASTVGFKSDRAVFEDLLYQNVRQAGSQSSQDTRLPSGMMLGTGVRVVATEKKFTQGSLQQTGRELDFAIQGRGFFEVLTPSGQVAYTRDGNMQRNAQGEMVTSSGYVVQPGITIPDGAQSVSVANDGTVTVQIQGEAQPTQVGTLQLVDFINPSGLQARGENLFQETAASGAPQAGTAGQGGLGGITQNALETSNVNVVEELVNMIETQRAYEINSRAIASADEMLQYVTNNL